jgi:hypothetical protein
MLSGPPSVATEREGAVSNRVATAAATASNSQEKTEPAEGAGELLISVALAIPVLNPLKSKAKAVPRSRITGHPVYSSGCPEVVRW